MKSLSVVIPAFNEEKGIKKVIVDIKKHLDKNKVKYEIVIVDDGSKDRTSEIVSKLNVNYIRHVKNKGVGAARNTGLKAAKYEYIVMLDGDGTYPADRIMDLVRGINDYDMVVGSRKSESGTLFIIRGIMKFIIRILASYISGNKIPDLNSGMRVFRKHIAMKFLHILPNTHSWVSTITLCYLCNNYDIKYIPIDYYKRKGKSTFHPFRDTITYISLVFKTIMYFNPLKIFLPIALGLLLWGGWRTVYHAKFSIKSEILESDIIIMLIGTMIAVFGLLADLVVKQFRLQYIDTCGKKN